MPILGMQPEDVERIAGVDFENVGPDSCWETRDWHGIESQQNKLMFIHDLEMAIEAVKDENSHKVILDDLLNHDQTPNSFFDATAERMSNLGFYVYNSDNFFEIFKASDVEALYDNEELAEMLETPPTLPSRKL